MELTRSEATRLLMIAVKTGSIGSITIALDCGADVHKRDRGGRTPLMRACRAPNPDPRVVRMLLRAGADASAVDSKRKTALDYARLVCLERSAPPDDPEEAARSLDRAARAHEMPEKELMAEFELKGLAESAQEMSAEDFAEFRPLYVASRREAASKPYFDTAGIERVIELLENAMRG